MLHLLDGGRPLVDVELLLLLLVHPRVVLVAPERMSDQPMIWSQVSTERMKSGSASEPQPQMNMS